MSTDRSLRLVSFVCLFVPAVFATSASIPAQGTASSRVYVSVEDTRGASVGGLSPADFVIRVEGKDVRVLNASPATEPVSLIVVTEGLTYSHAAPFRRAMKDLIAALPRHSPQSRVGLMLEEGTAIPTMHRVVEDAEPLDRAVSRFYESPRSAPFLESLMVATSRLADEPNPRRAVLAVTIRMERAWSNTVHPQKIVDALRDSGTALWSVDFPTWNSPGGVAENRVLLHATRQSGGKRQSLMSFRLDLGMKNFADLLLSQYAVSYEHPGAAAPMTLRVGVRRDGVSVHAPGWTSAGINGVKTRPAMN